MAIVKGDNLPFTIAPRLEGSGTPPTNVSLQDWVRAKSPDDNLLDRVQMRVATVPVGEPNAGRRYLGISGQYALTGDDGDLTTAQANAYFAAAAARSGEYAGGVDPANPGWRFFFTNIADAMPVEYRIEWSSDEDRSQTAYLFDRRAHLTPPIFVETLTAARLSFRPFRFGGLGGTDRHAAQTIVEHRFTFVDSEGAPYNLPLAPTGRDEDISWPDNADYALDVVQQVLPWMRGVPGSDTVELGPGTTITGLTMRVREVTIVPAQVALPENVNARTIQLRTEEGAVFDLPRYAQGGQELIEADAYFGQVLENPDLDGLWTIDDTPEFKLLHAERARQGSRVRVWLTRDHPFIERSQ